MQCHEITSKYSTLNDLEMPFYAEITLSV